MKQAYTAFFMLLAAVVLWSPAYAQSTIKKCQDAEGKWHYGDFAASECARAKITEINEGGTKIGEDLPPPTAAELARQKQEKSAWNQEKERLEIQRRGDQKIVETYSSKEVIVSTRDRHLGEIDRNVAVTRQLRDGILKDIADLEARKPTAKTQEQIAERKNAVTSYDQVLWENLNERAKLELRYKGLLQRFDEAEARLREGSKPEANGVEDGGAGAETAAE